MTKLGIGHKLPAGRGSMILHPAVQSGQVSRVHEHVNLL